MVWVRTPINYCLTIATHHGRTFSTKQSKLHNRQTGASSKSRQLYYPLDSRWVLLFGSFL